MPPHPPVNSTKPVVIGIYGIPGSGKTSLLNGLKESLGTVDFEFHEGSEEIDRLCPDGLRGFQILSEKEKVFWRQRAIDSISDHCCKSGKTAVVTGHLMFWSEGSDRGNPVYTENDLSIYTHIFYLNVSAYQIIRYREADTNKSRLDESVCHLNKWKTAEIKILRNLCPEYGILLSLLTESGHTQTIGQRLLAHVQDARLHNGLYNNSCSNKLTDEFVISRNGKLKTVLVMDADRTLAAEDAGELFWKHLSEVRGRNELASSLKDLFSSSLGYSYTAFRQATFLYEDAVDEDEFDRICSIVASEIIVHPEILSLLKLTISKDHIGVVIVTSGLRRVWENVLRREGLSNSVGIIGGGRLSDQIVVTDEVKQQVVSRLRHCYKQYVLAFGDSPLDLNMLGAAHHAIAVVGQKHLRSKTMDAELEIAIENGLHAAQVCLPSTSTPRLDQDRLPVIHLTDPGFVSSVLSHPQNSHIELLHATDEPGAKLLATSMRDAKVAGPQLRSMHHRAGLYLSLRYITELITLEECAITHVLGQQTSGYRLAREKQTLIVPLMRGGEPMAMGVNDAFPQAMFVHAKEPCDLKTKHLEDVATLILVDSVINTGQSVIQFVKRVKAMRIDIRIVVVAGVVQDQAVVEGGALDRELGCLSGVTFVALRLSKTRFVGTKGTDTGNRLFNTTHLD